MMVCCIKRVHLCKRKNLALFVIGVAMLTIYIDYASYSSEGDLRRWQRLVCQNFTPTTNKDSVYAGNVHRQDKPYLITWFELSPYIRYRTQAWQRGFKQCKYQNCQISLCSQTSAVSDAVIFNGRRLPETLPFSRPPGQIWIFAEDESPYSYDYDGGHWRSEFWRKSFNWTMVYDKFVADIYLPSGELWKKSEPDLRDFLQIAKDKTKDALLITSHCTTESKRSEYVEELRKYIDVDILGTCGRKWSCGKLWVHDECFSILNKTYRYYLSFENALCRGYRTEKFFENFNFDILMVARGGIAADDVIEPKDVYISTADFANVEKLGRHLKQLSEDYEAYADFLEKKSQYYFPGFHESYQSALCDLCEKMNHQSDHRKIIPDLVEHMTGSHPCRDPTDVTVVEETGWWSWLWKKW